MHFNAVSSVDFTNNTAGTGLDCWFKAGVSEAATIDITGYTLSTLRSFCVAKIESLV